MKRIRVLKVGLAGMGGGNLRTVCQTPGFEVVAGVDVTPKARRAFEAELGAPSYAKFEDALREVEADAAIISTPNRFHAPYSIAAMKAGFDVLTEKPMAVTMTEARRMHRVAEQTGRILMVKQNLRWMPVHLAAAERLRKGAVGRIRQVDYDFFVHNARAVTGFRRKIPYLIYEDLGIHHFDLLRFLTGKKPTSVYAVAWPAVGKPTAPPASAGRAIIEFEGPITVSYRGEMLSISDETSYGCRYTVTGTKGVLWVRDGKLFVRSRDAALAGDEPEAVPDAEVARFADDTFMKAFGQAVRTRKAPMTHSGDNLDSLALMFGAIKSADSGRIVTF